MCLLIIIECNRRLYLVGSALTGPAYNNCMQYNWFEPCLDNLIVPDTFQTGPLSEGDIE